MKALKEHLNIFINRYKNPVFNDEFNNSLLTADIVFDNIENLYRNEHN